MVATVLLVGQRRHSPPLVQAIWRFGCLSKWLASSTSLRISATRATLAGLPAARSFYKKAARPDYIELPPMPPYKEQFWPGVGHARYGADPGKGRCRGYREPVQPVPQPVRAPRFPVRGAWPARSMRCNGQCLEPMRAFEPSPEAEDRLVPKRRFPVGSFPNACARFVEGFDPNGE